MPRTYKKYYLSDYEITREGNVINKQTGKKLKPQMNSKGYLRFGAQTEKGKRFFLIHRLVAKKYVPNPLNKPQVNHIDGNKLNNRADNLEWVSNKENRSHAIKNGLQIHGEKCPWSKLKQKDVEFIKNHSEMSRHELANMFNISEHTISDIRTGRSWKS